MEPNYCPFCGSNNIAKAPKLYHGIGTYVLKGHYLCKDCDRGFELSLVTIPWKIEILKEAIERGGEDE